MSAGGPWKTLMFFVWIGVFVGIPFTIWAFVSVIIRLFQHAIFSWG